jgi:hypothetical protein
MQDGGLHRILPKFCVLFLKSGLVAGSSLRRDEPFANLGHACGGRQRVTGDLALHGIFRKPERIGEITQAAGPGC